MKKRLLRYRLAACVCSVVLLTVSCSDWLDVKPKTEVEAEDMFSSEEGFKGVLAGIYTAMNQPDLYGRELTFGLVDAVGQQWKIPATNHTYSDAVKYEYESVAIKGKIDAIWKGLYNTIANVNGLLEYIDQKKDVFSGDNQAIIKGEALALRAYLHFDLLRLFAPYGMSTSAEDGIPYQDRVSKQVTVSLSPKEVIGKIVADLTAAAQCLQVDPVLTGREVTTEEDGGYLINRDFHLNYYAVTGLLARVQLYAGNTTEAYNNAKIVIDAHNNQGKFPWVKKADVVKNDMNATDRTFSSEHLFALNMKKLVDYIDEYFTSTTSPLLTRITPDALFEIEEYRQRFFNGDNVPTKLWQIDNYVDAEGNTQKPVRDRMPMIRLSEMYYIAAECKKANAAEAIGYLNEVLKNRGYEEAGRLLDPAAITIPEVVQAEILKEYQREFICEGQLFFYHKRMGDEKINADRPEVKYVFPKPDTELEFGK